MNGHRIQRMVGVFAVAAACLTIAPRASADIVHNDDVIIDGSLCVGFDCVNGENFGFDTLRLKENNLRIHFNDTSNSASFPTADWRIVANDTSNGGAEFLAFEDTDRGTQPFRVTARAGANALTVDAQGDVGLGTANAVVELHIVDGDTPTIRLEQNGSSGFTPQTWDIAGNETNFFIRDVTNGSTLPIRIEPGVSSNTLYLENEGANDEVGIGTSNPEDRLHVNVAGGNGGVLIQSTSNLPQLSINNAALSANDGRWRFRVNSQGNFVFIHADDNSTTPVTMFTEADTNLLFIGGTSAGSADNDRVTVNGELFVGATQVPDYVFEPEYKLESIEQHAEYMWRNKHLPAVGAAPTPDDNGNVSVNVTSQQNGILEELEKAHIYIEQLNQKLDSKDAVIRKLNERLENVESQVAGQK